MSLSEVWNDALETTPDGSNAVSVLDNRIKELKVDIRERMQVEHNFSTHGGGTDDGTHKAGLCGVAKVDTTVVLAALADVNNAIGFDTTLYQPVYNAGAGWVPYSVVPTGAKTVWYSDTALTGWTLIDTMDDKVLFVTKGSVAGGETGGGAHSAGTWTQPNHTHTGPSHTHEPGTLGGTTAAGTHNANKNSGSSDNPTSLHTHSFTVTTGATATSGTGATSASATVNTWRPAAYCFTVQSKK